MAGSNFALVVPCTTGPASFRGLGPQADETEVGVAFLAAHLLAAFLVLNQRAAVWTGSD